MIISAVLLFTMTAIAKVEPPEVFVDKGACPFECCTYRDWIVKADTPVLDSIDGKKVVGSARVGERITGISGEVHTMPGKVTVSSPHGKFKTGDELYILTYLGEGIYKIWTNGTVSEDADVYQILDEEGQRGKGPNASKNNWAKLNKQPKST